MNASETYGPTICESSTCGPYDCDCTGCREAMEAEHAAEMHAEGAWLRAAQNSTPQHELDYELEREAQDAGLQYLRSREGA